MGWFKIFTSSPENGRRTSAKIKTDKNGTVTDIIYDLDKDKKGGKHGHVWGLGSDDDDDIGGRNSSD